MQVLPRRDGRIPRRYLLNKLRKFIGNGKYQLTIYDYSAVLDILLREKKPDFLDYPVVLSNWDNTPRCGLNGLVLHGSAPELFRIHLRKALDQVSDYSVEHKFIFLKAWNEWAEGNYVEPDLRFGKGYLEVLKQEVIS
jgi:hypothetical protein